MFSIADMAVAGAVALLLFGPDQLPKVARRAGQLVRDVQNTSQSFIREMERAADAPDAHDVRPSDPFSGSALPAAPVYHETPEPAAHEHVASEAALGRHPEYGEAVHTSSAGAGYTAASAIPAVPGPAESARSFGEAVPSVGNGVADAGKSVAGPAESLTGPAESVAGPGESVPGLGESAPGPGHGVVGGGKPTAL